MLESRRMDSRALRQLAAATVACLLTSPLPTAHAVGLRDEAVTYRQEGFDRQQRGDIQGAVEAYQKAVALDPSYPAPYNDLGVLFEQLGQIEDAKKSYEQALVIDPNYLKAHANLALLYERLSEKEKAIFHWLKRYQLGDPNDAWTARAEERLVALGVLKAYPGLKGRIYTRQRLVAEALKEHEQSIDEFHRITEEHGDWP